MSHRWSSENHCGHCGNSAASPGRPSPVSGKNLVPGVAVLVLQVPERVSVARARSGGVVHRAQRVLRRVARAHAAAGPGLVAGDEARPVERRPALDLVPDVDHRVELGVGRLDGEAAEVLVPVGAQRGEGGLDRVGVAERLPCTRDLGFVVGDPEHEDDLVLLAGQEVELVAERADAVPARRLGVRGLAALDDDRVREVAAAADERLPVGVEAERLRRSTRRRRSRDGALPPAG